MRGAIGLHRVAAAVVPLRDSERRSAVTYRVGVEARLEQQVAGDPRCLGAGQTLGMKKLIVSCAVPLCPGALGIPETLPVLGGGLLLAGGGVNVSPPPGMFSGGELVLDQNVAATPATRFPPPRADGRKPTSGAT